MDEIKNITQVDRLIHEPSRLAIITILSACERADFTYLLNATGLSKGNLSSHLQKLEAADYVHIKKGFKGNYPHRTYSITREGRRQFAKYKKQYLALAKELAAGLVSLDLRVVFAESCTGGMAAAAITSVPGVSSHFCGSAVTYRERTKKQWLEIPNEVISEHTTESAEVTEAMALAVLRKTKEADLAAAITGHFGPDAPDGKDGVIFIAIAVRNLNECECVRIETERLTAEDRVPRQLEAATSLIRLLTDVLKDHNLLKGREHEKT